jgi:hypothetical protein
MLTSWFARGVWSKPLLRDVTSDALCARLSDHRPAPPLPWCCPDCPRPPRLRFRGTCRACGAELALDKRELPAWSPWAFRDGVRSQATAVATSCLSIDYDGGVDIDGARRMWAPWLHVGHTSWSHAEGAPRVRIVLPLASAVPVASGAAEAGAAGDVRGSAYAQTTWPQLWRWAWERDPRADASAAAVGRLWYLPAAREGRPHAAWRHEGPLLDVDALRLPELSPEDLRDASRRPGDDASRPADGDGWFRGQPPRRWNRDPDARRAFGLQLGGRVAGEGEAERIVGVTCPSCDRPSLWWPVHPRPWGGCGCSHRKTCGYVSWLDDLARVRA